ncbi:MAG: carbohydrate ABC transporter permease [Anaerolineales bacterium]|nr:carbohydrate ABC transporter permease [Anaerolineales bacterium]
MKTSASKSWLAPQNFISFQTWEKFGRRALNFFIFGFLIVYLFPMLYMVAVSVMDGPQLADRNAPAYPARHVRFEYQGQSYSVYKVPFENEQIRQLALIKPGRTSSEFVDPANPQAGVIVWNGNWRKLIGVYEFHLTFENFTMLFNYPPLGRMIQNTLVMTLIAEIGVLFSSIVVAYGFSRFRLPGGDALFYILIATILIPEKVTLIPTYFFFVRVLDWNGSWLPILLPFFFGNAVYIFLLRQNFKSIPKDLDEAAMLDGAGPFRILFQVLLPQTWPTVITISLLHFFYMWNETRQAALYLSIRRDLAPISFGIQNFQSLAPIQNQLQASALILMIVPVIVLILSQKFFMRDVVVTGMEK